MMAPNGEKLIKVTAVAGNSFTVDSWTENSEKIFVFGKEVNDFRIVDYDRLFTLNLSATKELNKRLAEQQHVIDALHAQDAESKKKIAVLEASLLNIQSTNTDLEKLKAEIETIKRTLGLEAKGKKD